MPNLPAEDPKRIKILFMGLDNAGKTSIILTLLRQLSKIIIIEPTKGARTRVYEFLGVEVSEWDLGGHAAYRAIYLRTPNMYFEDTDILIYVIDIQDNSRISESLNFLVEILIRFKSMGIGPLIYIFSHKFDPIPFITSQEKISSQAETLQNSISTILNYPEDKVQFYKTSIFSIPSIINTISRIISSKVPSTKLISEFITEFAKKMDFEGLVLVDDNSLIICSFYKDEQIQFLIDRTIPHFLEVNDSFRKGEAKRIEQRYEEGIIVKKFDKYFLFKEFTLKPDGPTYYFLSCMKQMVINQENFEAFINQIREILKI